ncbi:MAG: TetR/AcrR family transcriptional regulator [Myxococcota bacterium]
MTTTRSGQTRDAPGDAGALRREEKKQVSRQKILVSAREVFFRDGFMAANLDEVAQRAGVAKGTLYRYFDSKAELYVAVLADNGEIFKQRMRETVDGGANAAERIQNLATFYYDHWIRNHDYFQIFWAIENQAVIGELPPGVLDEVTKLWEECIEIVAGIVAEGVERGEFAACDPWEMANILWTVANGLIQADMSPTRRSLRRARLETVFSDAIALFLRGLAA